MGLGKENSRLILCRCALGVCEFHLVGHTVEGTDPVLFGPPAKRWVFEGVTQRIAAAAKTCRPLGSTACQGRSHTPS